MKTQAAVEITHLRKTYGDVVAVDDLSLSVAEGEIFGILGPNGAGKTTTVECVLGLRSPDAGSIRVLGLDPGTPLGASVAAIQDSMQGQFPPAEPLLVLAGYTDYLRAYARKKEGLWIPGTSGGDHTTAWPEPVTDLLKKRLDCSPPGPYSFAASEAFRLHAFKLDRAQVRRWAIEKGYAHATPPKRPHAPVRRWQRSQIGELWQLDASPHRWFPPCSLDFPMLNMLDDCSRVFVGAKLYGRELLLSYLDFLPAAFLIYGRPLQIYVDYHAMFFSQNPD